MANPSTSARIFAPLALALDKALNLTLLLILYPPGFFWGSLPEGFPNIGPAHPPSPFDALHPYLYMLGMLYLAFGILLIKGAKDPRRNIALFDWGILSSVLHGGIMIFQSFYYPNEHAHLWADVPMLFGIAFVMWFWYPDRKVAA